VLPEVDALVKIRTGSTISPSLGYLAAVGSDAGDAGRGEQGTARARFLEQRIARARSDGHAASRRPSVRSPMSRR